MSKPEGQTGAESRSAVTRAPQRFGVAFAERMRREPMFRPGLRTYATFVLFTAFAGDFWRNLLGWYGWGALVAGTVVLTAVIVARTHPKPRITHLPTPLLLFLAWCALSLMWSQYPGATLIGLAGQLAAVLVAYALAATLTRVEVLAALARAVRLILAMSLAFEVFVATFFPQGLLPLYLYPPGELERYSGIPGATPETANPLAYWSQGHLFMGLSIQGITGNRNLLGFVCLLVIITTAVQMYSRRMGAPAGVLWIGTALGTLFLARSATPIVIIPVILLAVGLVWIGRRVSNRGRWLLYAVVFTCGCAGAVALRIWNDEIFGLINRSGDLSGRGTVWHLVAQLGAEHPIVGLGWVSYWAPWVEPFKSLVFLDGVRYLQAHNAYLDVWMQTGVVGLSLFAVFVFTTLVRTWWTAIGDRAADRRPVPPERKLAPDIIVPTRDEPLPRWVTAGFLIMVALTVQSLTESRLLIEGNWLMLCYLAISSKLHVQDVPVLPRHTIPTHTGPVTLPASAGRRAEA